MKENNAKSKKRFWTILGAYVAVVLIAGAIGLRFFYDYTADYEYTRPDSAAERICESFGDDTLTELIGKEFSGKVSEYESIDSAVKRVIIPALGGSSFNYNKLATEYTASAPVYMISSSDGGREIAKIYLEQSEDSTRFGLHAWKLKSAELVLDLSNVKTFTFTVSAPENAYVSVNGKPLSSDMILSTEPYKTVKWESASAPKANIYKIEGMLAVPEVKAVNSENQSFDVSYTDNGCTVEFSEQMSKSVSITAPSDATVRVGGVKLTEDEVAEFVPYSSDNAFNAASNMIKYKISGLLTEPQISAESPAGELKLTKQSENDYLYETPENLYHNIRIIVPSNIETEIKVNGIALTDEYISSNGGEKHYPEIDEIAKFIVNPASVKEYTVSGLYQTPEVEVKAVSGVELVHEDSGEKDVYTYTPPYDDSLKQSYENVVKKYVSAYINYTANGGTNTMTHFAKVKECLLPDSQAYREMQNTVYSFSQNFQFKVKSQSITTYDYRSWGDNCFSCSARFDVVLSRWRDVEDSAVMKLFYVKKGDSWLLAKVNIVSAE